jgi:hypothetical protein
MADQDDAGRAKIDPDFAPSERLFRRVPAAALLGDSVDDIALPAPSFSVNREKYSAPRDVLRGLDGFRVAAFAVRDLPSNVAGEDSSLYRMGVEHEPEEDNYAHSGVHTFREGIKLINKPSKLIRKKLRDLLRRKITILNLDTLD